MEENKIFTYSYDIQDIVTSWKDVNSSVKQKQSENEIMNEFIQMVLKYEAFPIINSILKDYVQLKISITKKEYNKYGVLTDVVISENYYDLVEMRKIVDIEHVKFEDFIIATDY